MSSPTSGCLPASFACAGRHHGVGERSQCSDADVRGVWHRNYGLQLYEDSSTIKVDTRFGDVTSDSAFVQSLVADGQFAHVWTGAVLHVLPQDKVEALIRSVFAMLRPGGSYFGTCVGTSGQPTEWQPGYRNRAPAYLHTAESLTELLQRVGFVEVVVHEPLRPVPIKVPLLFLGAPLQLTHSRTLC
jgi:hypothetical protein